MEEMKKFIRYVVPGLVVMVEFIGSLGLILLFTDVDLLKLYMDRIFSFGDNFGAPLSLFLLSGGLGAFLATIYHNTISSRCIDCLNVDYSNLLKYCEDKNFIQILSWDGKTRISSRKLRRIGQWRILTAFWHINQNEKDSKFFKDAERRAETLHDIAHGQGTQFVGSFMVILMLALFDFYYPASNFGWWYILPITIILLHFFAFEKVIHSIQTVLSNFYIKGICSIEKHPYTLYVSDIDLIKNSSKHALHSTGTRAENVGTGPGG